MSVILDALHKERNNDKSGPAGALPTRPATGQRGPTLVRETPTRGRAENRAAPGSSGVLGVVTIMAMLILLLVVGGLFFVLYRIQPNLLQPVGTEQSSGNVARNTTVPVDLPPPVPIQQLVPQNVTASLPPPPVAATAAVTEVNEPAVKPLKLGSIVCENGDCLALLDGRTVRAGDAVQGYTVTEISPTAVTLEKSGAQPLVLSLL